MLGFGFWVQGFGVWWTHAQDVFSSLRGVGMYLGRGDGGGSTFTPNPQPPTSNPQPPDLERRTGDGGTERRAACGSARGTSQRARDLFSRSRKAHQPSHGTAPRLRNLFSRSLSLSRSLALARPTNPPPVPFEGLVTCCLRRRSGRRPRTPRTASTASSALRTAPLAPPSVRGEGTGGLGVSVRGYGVGGGGRG